MAKRRTTTPQLLGSIEPPTEPGVYWGRCGDVAAWHYLFVVKGEAPYLTMKRIQVPTAQPYPMMPRAQRVDAIIYGPRVDAPSDLLTA